MIQALRASCTLAVAAGLIVAGSVQSVLADNKAAPAPNAAQPGQPSRATPIQPGKPMVAQPGGPAKPVPPMPGGMTKAPTGTPTPTVQLKPGEVPKVSFDTQTYEFGRIRAGSEVRHDFWFTNNGNGPLEITAVRPSCGCTTMGQYDKVLKPGESGKIPIKVNTGAHSGPLAKNVTVTTNCPGTDGTVVLQIKGETWQLIDVVPPSATFGRLGVDTKDAGSLVRKLTIVNNGTSPAALTNVRVNNTQVKASVAELEKGKKFELTVSLIPPLKSGPLYANIEIASGVTEMPNVSVSVNAYVAAEVEVTPNQVMLPNGRTTALQRQLYVRSNMPTTQIKVSDLQVSSPLVKAAVKETMPGQSYMITLDIPADYKPGPGGDKITFKTGRDTLPSLTVPIVDMAQMTSAMSNTVKGAGVTRAPTMLNNKPAPPQSGQIVPAVPPIANPPKTGAAGH